LELVASVPQSAVCAQVNGIIPVTISENPGHDAFQWGIYRADGNPPIRCSAAGNSFHAELDIKFRAGQRLGIGPIGHISCGFDGDPMKRATVTLDTPLIWRDWHLEPNPRLDITLHDSCDLSVLRINANGIVLSKAHDQLNSYADYVSDKIRHYTDMQSLASNAWSAANKPVKLQDGIWLISNPTDVGVTSPSFSGDKLTVSAALTANPVIIFSSNAPNPANPSNLPAPHALVPANQFTAIVDGMASWKTISDQLTKNISKENYSWGPLNAQPVAVRAYGGAGVVIIAMEFKGSIKGTAYLGAKPIFDLHTNTIKFEDVDFTLATKDALGTIGGWLLQVGIPKYLESQSFNLDAPLNKLKDTLDPLLTRNLAPNLKMKGQLSDPGGVQILGLYAQNSGLVVRAKATGKVALEAQ
jgi:hypothetical protein